MVKDSSSGTWYDQGGTNYHIPLTGSVATMSVDEQIPDAELPDLPGELCGIWSYIKWEHAGCPNRTEHESQAAYREAIEVIFQLPSMLTLPTAAECCTTRQQMLPPFQQLRLARCSTVQAARIHVLLAKACQLLICPSSLHILFAALNGFP